MPTVQANGIDIYYEVQGEGEPMVLIPYLAADQACYACSHAPIYEDVAGFNQRTLAFLRQHAG
jgi:hypothetical protein